MTTITDVKAIIAFVLGVIGFYIALQGIKVTNNWLTRHPRVKVWLIFLGAIILMALVGALDEYHRAG
jgi:hypothetical protein